MVTLDVVDRSSLWVPYYNAVDELLSVNSTGLLVPFGDRNHEDSPTAPTKVTTTGAQQVDFTFTNSGRHLWETALTYEGPGQIPMLHFDGSTDWMETPDAPHWNDTAGSSEPSYNLALWVFVIAGASQLGLFMKTPNPGTTGTDWAAFIDSSERFEFRVADDLNNAYIGSRTSVLSPGWHWLTVTKHDDGITAASIITYVDGEANRSDNIAGSYTDQQDGTTVVRIGAESDGGSPNNNPIAGGSHGPLFEPVGAGAVWTPEQIRTFYQRQRVGLGV